MHKIKCFSQRSKHFHKPGSCERAADPRLDCQARPSVSLHKLELAHGRGFSRAQRSQEVVQADLEEDAVVALRLDPVVREQLVLLSNQPINQSINPTPLISQHNRIRTSPTNLDQL